MEFSILSFLGSYDRLGYCCHTRDNLVFSMGAPASSLGRMESVSLCKDPYMVVIGVDKLFRAWHRKQFRGKLIALVRSAYASCRMVVDFRGGSTSLVVANVR